MRFIKKVTLLTLLLFFCLTGIVSAYELVMLPRHDSGYLQYRGNKGDVLIPDSYTIQDRDFRGVWISHFVSDFPSYQNENQYKQEVQKVLDVMEYFNLNTMIFHVRTHNNAFYKSKLNPVSSYYSKVDFDQFDPLAYIIEEAHKRGIEFHAWMNPYRIGSGVGTPEQYAQKVPKANVASNPDMLLANGSFLILNPGEPAVRKFLVDTCMELIENYDIDAIHFDDYFYVENVDDSLTRKKYNTQGLSIDDFRRKQVDLFIESLHNAMEKYNLEHNRCVQLGISPSGIYRNANYVPLNQYQYDENGTLINPVGSNTKGFEHYPGYLYADTKKWIDNEWIDYILPQSYWGFERDVAGFADVIDWWSGVVKYKDVNLYAGMGIYMIESGHTTDSWRYTTDEAYNQVLYGTKYPEIQGHSIYSYKHVAYAYNKTNGRDMYIDNLTKVKNQAWTTKAIVPEIRTYNSIVLPKVENLVVETVDDKNVISFSKVSGAKFYVLYRSNKTVTFDPSEIIDIFGSSEDVITYTDDVSGKYQYGVKVLSATNSLSDGEVAEADALPSYKVVFKGFDGAVLKVDTVTKYQGAVAPTVPAVDGYTFVGWDQDFSNVTHDMAVKAVFDRYYYITFYIDGTEVAKYRSIDEFSLPDIPIITGYDQIAPTWDKTDFSNISADISVNAVYTINKYIVNFYDREGNLMDTQEVEYLGRAIPPKLEEVEGYKFVKWDSKLNEITRNLEVKPIYEKVNTGFISCQNFGLSFFTLIIGLGVVLIMLRKSGK